MMDFSVELLSVTKGDRRVGYIATAEDLSFLAESGEVKHLYFADHLPPSAEILEDQTPVQLSGSIDRAVDHFFPSFEISKFLQDLTGLQVFRLRIPEFPVTLIDDPLTMPFGAVAELDKEPCKPNQILRQLVDSKIEALRDLGIMAVTHATYPLELALLLFEGSHTKPPLLKALMENPVHGAEIKRTEQRRLEILRGLLLPPPPQ